MSQELPLNRVRCPQIGAIGLLGGEADGYGFFARPGESPIGMAVRKLIGIQDIADRDDLKGEIRYLYESFELWLIPHSVSIIRRAGKHEVVYIGIEIKYKNGRRTCSVRGMAPSFQYVTHGVMKANLDVGGGLTITDDALPEAKAFSAAGLRFHVGVDSGLKVRLEANVATPYIAAIGLESDCCEWRFDRHEEPLFGRDVRTYSIVALPKDQRELLYEIRYYIGLRRVLITRRIESEWIELRCPLKFGDPIS